MIVEKSTIFSAIFPSPNLVIEPGTFKGTERELAQAIKQQVETYPETFDMSVYVGSPTVVYSDHYDYENEKIKVEQEDPNVCGTTLCIAGYAQLFVDGEITLQVVSRAAELLGLDSGTRLFYVTTEYGKNLLNNLVEGTFHESMIPMHGEGYGYGNDEY